MAAQVRLLVLSSFGAGYSIGRRETAQTLSVWPERRILLWGSWLACEGIGSVRLNHRVRPVAGKPAPTSSVFHGIPR